jgi:uncharacterized protein DUF6011
MNLSTAEHLATQNYLFTSGSADTIKDDGRRLSVLEAKDMVGRLTTWPAIKEFMFAGHALFTLRSLNTGMRYTYKVDIKKADRDAKLADPMYFVKLLRGQDNQNDYLYMGVLRRDMRFRLTSASKLGRTAPAFVSLVWFLDKMARERDVLGAGAMPALVEFWHAGRCGRCGRTLTVPESVASGIGPVCDGRDL